MFEDNKKTIIIGVFLFLAASGYAVTQKMLGSVTRSVTTIGTGKKQVAADKATLTFSISTSGNDQSAVITTGENKTNDVFKSLQSFAPTNVRKTAYQVTQSGNGYQYATGVQLTVDATKVQNVTQIITASGNSVAQIKYSSSTDKTASQEARTAAIADARMKAEQIAKASGARVGKVLVVSEQSGTDQTGSSITGTKSALSDGAFNEAEISSSLSVTFELN